MSLFDNTDWAALGFFLATWVFYGWFTDHGPLSGRGLSAAMHRERAQWMRVAASRDLRMIDTAIVAGLQQGTAFFASASIFAIGGCFAMLGSTDVVASISADLPFQASTDRPSVELKLLGLVVIFCYAFFKFAWSYRLFNYCSILVGAIPMLDAIAEAPEQAERAVWKATRLNQLGATHFNTGLRATFFALAYLGWFLGPYGLIATTLFVVAIIANRQYRSPAFQALTAERDGTKTDG